MNEQERCPVCGSTEFEMDWWERIDVDGFVVREPWRFICFGPDHDRLAQRMAAS